MQQDLKKVLIISYFFPPCNLTGAQRILGWAKYLKAFGYYPIIVTRNWERPVNNLKDLSFSSGKKIEHIITEEYEVYYLPYKASLKDRIYTNYGNRFSFIRKFFSFIEIVLQFVWLATIPFSNIYYFSKKLLLTHKDIRLLIVSANPFISFRFGYLLNKKFGISWIADYRDDWHTHEIVKNENWLAKKWAGITVFYEKKWLKTASFFTSVSDIYVKKINALVQTPGHTVANGYFENILNLPQQKPFDDFTLCYNGALYANQRIDLFLTAVKKWIDQEDKKIRLKILFIGTALDPIAKNNVMNEMHGYEMFVEFTNRVSTEDAIRLQQRSHVFFTLCYGHLKGIPSSKIYEYIALKKPVIVYPSDHDIIEASLKYSNTGVFPKDEQELILKLKYFYNNYLAGIYETSANENAIRHFSRKTSTQKLAALLDTVC